MEDMKMEKLKQFAKLVEKQTIETLKRRLGLTYTGWEKEAKTTIKQGKKYTKVDVGTSGKFMVDSDGNIFGIKGYGVIYRGHSYGTLDTIDQYYWGEFHPIKLY